jgi:GxxExxY protein
MKGGFVLNVASPLTAREELLITRAIDCAFAVHRELGPGFRERIYQKAYCLELNAAGVTFECEKPIDVQYKEWQIPGQRVDLVIEGLVLVEIKAVPKLVSLHERQVRSYLKTMGIRAAVLVNFNTTLLKHGLRRIVRA